MTYPHHPGSRGIETSIAAAEWVAPVAGGIRSLVLASVRKSGARGITTNELAELLNIDRGTVQPRTSELRALGSIRDSGYRRLNANGKRAIVWVATGGDA